MTTLLTQLLAQSDGTLWLPPQASTHGPSHDTAWYFIYYVSAFFLALIVFLMIFFVIRYRRRDESALGQGPSHSTVLEVTWSVIPTILVVTMFFMGFRVYLDKDRPPSGAYEIQVNAYMWDWEFVYPNGTASNVLHVPANTPVKLRLTSRDVIHSLFVPAFRLKKDCVPGRYNFAWFEAVEEGIFPLYCAEYCGRNHSAMITEVVVQDVAQFQEWLREQSNFLDTMSPVEAGRKLYEMKGCYQCHSVDGSARQGPSFQNIYDYEHQMLSGESVLVDDNYLRESILYPQNKIVAGYENAGAMPTYQGRLDDAEIDAIIAYIKSLSDRYEPPTLGQEGDAQQGDSETDASSTQADGAQKNTAERDASGETATQETDASEGPGDSQNDEPAGTAP